MLERRGVDAGVGPVTPSKLLWASSSMVEIAFGSIADVRLY
jgi:hypothetical protein